MFGCNKKLKFLSTTVFSRPRFITVLPSSLLSTANPSVSFTKQAHACIVVSGLHGNASFLGHLIALLALCPSTPLEYSFAIHQTINNPPVFMSNNMIRCIAKSESPRKSLVFYSDSILRSCARPNNYTFTFLLQACSKSLGLCEGVQIHGQLLRLGFGQDVYVKNALIHFYSCCCKVESSKKVFEESPQRCDVVTWNVMLAGFARDGELSAAENLFVEMPERDVVSWNTMIMAYVHNGKLEESLDCFRRMRECGLPPNEATLVTMLSASAQLGLLGHGRMVHSLIDLFNIPMTVTLGSALLDMYAKCGCIEQARIWFDKLPRRDISTWNVMICGLASHGLAKEALALFRRFLNEGLCPVNVTFIGVLNACSRAGLVKEGWRYFRLMGDVYGIEPEMEHYGCMVDLLGRAGLVSQAVEMIESMDLSRNPVLWATLLCACRIHGLEEMGQSIGHKLIQLDPTYDGHYVQLSSIYAKSKKWEDVVRVRKLMVERNTCKVTGWSLIEDQGMVHRFVSGDREHKRSLEIYKMLERIETRLAEAGYTPNIVSVLHDIGEEEKEIVIKVHSERLAIAFGFLVTSSGACIRIVKNLRVCSDCHEFSKMISRVFEREIIVRDVSRFHHFKEGKCSCADYW
ncbi:hypothetical protein K2173_009081 [Erythroxylum novogranatense]|uniref:DYW domain-containing protein n=1 Tax=Erythroxylum novogranatense TaxID=1862640 RepID=A0AAV8TW91_9ROSI|nr:hypothetical protein K2173_009081 [Erythroxylum novogranatense]